MSTTATSALVPAWCQVHHIRHWARGGATDLSNLVLVCHHHHLLHEGGWTMQGDAELPDGLVVRTPRGAVHDPARAGTPP